MLGMAKWEMKPTHTAINMGISQSTLVCLNYAIMHNKTGCPLDCITTTKTTDDMTEAVTLDNNIMSLTLYWCIKSPTESHEHGVACMFTSTQP